MIAKSKKKALSDSARTLFSKKGFHGTTMRDITKEAKGEGTFSVSNTYYFFDDKSHLFKHVCELAIHDTKADMGKLSADINGVREKHGLSISDFRLLAEAYLRGID